MIGLTITIKSKETADNPGLKAMAKLCLNSLWGKFGQRGDLDHHEYYHEAQRTKFIQKILDPRFKIKSWDIINEHCVELKSGDVEQAQVDNAFISEITAAFTTANARVRLYEMLTWVHHSQVIYCDTDSIIFIYDKTNPLHKYPSNDATDRPKLVSFGRALSQWENEFKDEGEWIVEIVVAGAKSYSYKTNKGNYVLRMKGITMDKTNSDIISIDSMTNMVLNQGTLQSAARFSFTTDPETRDVITRCLNRSIRSTVGEKRKLHGYDTLPFGYEGELGESIGLGVELGTQKVEQTKRAKPAKEAKELGKSVESVIALASVKIEKRKEAKAHEGNRHKTKKGSKANGGERNNGSNANEGKQTKQRKETKLAQEGTEQAKKSKQIKKTEEQGSKQARQAKEQGSKQTSNKM